MVFCSCNNCAYNICLNLAMDFWLRNGLSKAFHSLVVLTTKVRPPSVSRLYFAHTKLRPPRPISEKLPAQTGYGHKLTKWRRNSQVHKLGFSNIETFGKTKLFPPGADIKSIIHPIRDKHLN